MYVDVKPVVTIVARMDIHAMGGGYSSRGVTIAYNAVFWGGYYSRGATKQRGRLFKEIRYTTHAFTQDSFKLL